MRPPVLYYADILKPFKLHTDTSYTGQGAVLYQNQEGMGRVVANASRSLRPTKLRYTIIGTNGMVRLKVEEIIHVYNLYETGDRVSNKSHQNANYGTTISHTEWLARFSLFCFFLLLFFLYF